MLVHDDISPQRKSDPGPAWDMQRFRAMLGGRADASGGTADFAPQSKSQPAASSQMDTSPADDGFDDIPF